MNKLMKTMAALALVGGTAFTFGMAHAHGGVDSLVGEDSGSFQLSARMHDAGQTRAQVRAAAAAARDSGEATALVGEDSGSFHLSRANGASTLSRAQVREEMLQARASGEIAAWSGEDSGSAYLGRPVPAHWTRYAGPNPGSDVGSEVSTARHDPHAA
jgi:hypothetical protein